jgi:hypothetical protein
MILKQISKGDNHYLKKQQPSWIKYENSTSKIYIRNIKDYTDIDPTVDFVFPVNKIDRENSENSFLRQI